MTTPAAESAHWDARTSDGEVWAVDPLAWEHTTAECVAKVLATIGHDTEGTVLEIGSGVGRLTLPIAERLSAATVVGWDVSSKMTDEAERRRASAKTPNARFVCGDGRNLPDGPLAAAYSLVCFQHVPVDVQRSWITQLGERLAPGARFGLQMVVGRDASPMNHHVSVPDVLDACRAAGLDATAEVGWMFPGWVWLRGARP